MEYATREQAQRAVNTLSHQNLMGRLVYVREVCPESPFRLMIVADIYGKDREAEPRFTGPPAGGRGGYEGGPRGGFGDGFGSGMAAAAGNSGRQIYVSNVCFQSAHFPLTCVDLSC